MIESAPPRGTREEYEQLHEHFAELCEIPSPTRSERAVADRLSAELREMGLEVEEDDSASETGSEAGNLLIRVAGPPGARCVLLSGHMDTVPLEAPVEVLREDRHFSNANQGILGADNKAAVAVIVAALRRLVADGPPVSLEVLLTTCEEDGLLGAKAFDRTRLRSDIGFVFDHASPVGELIVASPTYYRLNADVRGQAAHAGLHPERGHNAIVAAARAVSRMRLGRLDPETTANVGLIRGGTAANVVAERCHVELEARAIDADRASDLITEMVDALTEAATETACDVETRVEENFRGYRVARNSPPAQIAAQALEALGIAPRLISSGGGSDANVLIQRGLPCVNVANGTTGAHQPDEGVSEEALETMLDVVLGIVARA